MTVVIAPIHTYYKHNYSGKFCLHIYLYALLFFFLLSFPSPNCRYGILVPLVKHTWVVLDS